MSLKKENSGCSLKEKRKKKKNTAKKSLKKTKKSAGSLKKRVKSPDSIKKSTKTAGSLRKTKKSPDRESVSKSLRKKKSPESLLKKKKKSLSKKSNRSKRSTRSVGVSGHPKSLSSKKSAYQQSVGRTIHPKVTPGSGAGRGSGDNHDGSHTSNDSLTMLNWMMYTSMYGERLYDTIQLIFTCHCGGQKKVAMTLVEGRGLYLPFCSIKHGQSWMDSIGQFIQGKLIRENVAKLTPEVSNKLFASGSSSSSSSSLSFGSPTPFTNEPLLVEILRVQLPVYLDFVVRTTYRIQLTSAACKAKLCADNSIIGWYPVGEQLNAVLDKSTLFGPEPQLFIRPDGKVTKLAESERCREVAITDLFAYQCIGELREQKIGATGTTKDDILRAYGDYLQHVYPSEFMNESSFSGYLKRANLKITSNVSSLFRAFAARERHYLDFEEFIIGLLVVGRLIGQSTSSSGEDEVEEQNIPPPPIITHSPATMKLMADFAYRFYAVNTKHMSSEELDEAAKGFQIADADVSELKKAALANNEHIGRLKRADFVKLLVEKYIPKTSTSETPPLTKLFEQIHDRTPMEQLHVRLGYAEIRRVESELKANKAMQTKLQARLLCENCHQKQYCLAPYNLKMNRAGQMYQPMENKEEDVKRAPLSRRKLEKEYFESAFICNKIMDMLRQFAINAKLYPCVVKKRTKGNLEIKDWLNQSTRNDLVPEISNICQQAQKVIGAGPRILKVPSPCYVLGDIHGNFTDLMTFDANLWRSNAYFSGSNILFLGDYVDRGDYGLECILYLLCMKLMAPNQVHLLRGNHETRELQIEHTFFKECHKKFTGKQALKVFEAINNVFDVLPLVGVIDESIYCCHGGIPSNATLTQIAAISTPLKVIPDPSTANEILWNDPITDAEHDEMLANDPDIIHDSSLHPHGFPSNKRRGTANFFAEFALRRFLTANHLSHVIRAHECFQQGYCFHAQGKCVTIFSSSHYTNGINDAAVALVHDSQILVIKVDTIPDQQPTTPD